MLFEVFIPHMGTVYFAQRRSVATGELKLVEFAIDENRRVAASLRETLTEHLDT